jgi:hypothetical protein
MVPPSDEGRWHETHLLVRRRFDIHGVRRERIIFEKSFPSARAWRAVASPLACVDLRTINNHLFLFNNFSLSGWRYSLDLNAPARM